MNISEVLTILIFVLSFISGIITILIPFLKTKQAKNNAEKAVKALSAMELLVSSIQPLVIKAEQFSNFSGAEKKQWVMTQLRLLALEKSLIIDEEAVSEKVEEIVSTTNKVNISHSKQTVVEKNETLTVQG